MISLLFLFASIVETFEEHAESARKEWNVPGMAIALVQEGEIVYEKGFGVRGIHDPVPVDAYTLFQIGSLSKAFTTFLLAEAVTNEKLAWSDRVIEYDPTFRLKDGWVTAQFEIADLPAQHSGLAPYAGDTQAILGYSREHILEKMRFLAPVSSFRTEFAYQNNLFLVAANVLEKVNGKSFLDLLNEKIFSPLEMDRTSTTLETYLKSDNSAEWMVWQKGAEIVSLGRDFPFANWTYTYLPAGGINSSVHDMAKWLKLMARGGAPYVSEEAFSVLVRPHTFAARKEGVNLFYALGWMHQEHSPHPIIWHNGATLGVYNALGFIPEEKAEIVILTNGRGAELALALMFDFFALRRGEEMKFAARFLEEAKPKAALQHEVKEPPLPIERYAGTYQNRIYGDLEVSVAGKSLVATLGPKNTKLKLIPFERDLFSVEWPSFNASDERALFSMDAEGNITTLTLFEIKKEGAGSFLRK